MYTASDVDKTVAFFCLWWEKGQPLDEERSPFLWHSIHSDMVKSLPEAASAMLDDPSNVNDWLSWETTSGLLGQIGVRVSYADFASFSDCFSEEEDGDLTDGSHEFLEKVLTKLATMELNTKVEDWL